MKRSFCGLVLAVLMLMVSVLSLSTASSAQIGIGVSVRIGPPALPVYAQPICPGPGYLWTPGYWSWSDDDGYYWVPGTWVIAPVGLLWTPGYWAFSVGYYGWHPGYWGPHVGFYGGINYGFGYSGVGFYGGEWRGGAFYYNRAVLNVNVTNVRNVYSRTVVVNNVRTSFNGPGGIDVRPTRQEEGYGRERHTEALVTQREHERTASRNRQLFASENHGRPAIAATARPGEFSGHNLQRARAAGEPYHVPKISPQEARQQSGGNRGFSQSVRNGGRGSDRAAAGEPYRAPKGAPQEARRQSEGNRGFSQPARNRGSFTDRAMTPPENHAATNHGATNHGATSHGATSHGATNHGATNSEAKSYEAGNRGQMSSRDNLMRNSKPTRQENQAQKREETANRAQAKAEQKRSAREQRR